jgi:WD40 repeat protein
VTWLACPRLWIALALGIVAATVTSYWPASPRLVLRHDESCWHLAFSPDSTLIAMLDREPGLSPIARILVWDATTGTLLHRLECGAVLFPSRIVFAPDGKTLGLLDDGPITKWDLATGRIVATYNHAHWSHDAKQNVCREILFTPEGRWLLHDVGTGHIDDVETGELLHDYDERWPDRQLDVHGGPVVARVDGEIKTFDPISGAEIGRFPTAALAVPMARAGIAFSADGTHGVYFTGANQWVVHNATTGDERPWGRDSDVIGTWCLSADNRFLAVAMTESHRSVLAEVRRQFHGSPTQVRVFDATTGAEVGPSLADGSRACFAPDGRTLAVADRNDRLTLWDWPPQSRWLWVIAVGALTAALSYAIASRCSPRAMASRAP